MTDKPTWDEVGPELLESLHTLAVQLLPDAMCKEKGGLKKESRELCIAIVRLMLARAAQIGKE